MKIVTVLRTSESYKKEYVELLHRQCEKYAPEFEFTCISDDTSVPGYLEMKHDWPKWWPKIEIFKLKGPVLYLDLDTVIVNRIDDLIKTAAKHDFVVIRDFYKSAKLERTIGSGIMYWKNDMSYLYEEFIKNPEQHMLECTTSRWWGDQGFIEKNIGKTKVSYWQDITPNNVISWKVHCKGGIIPKTAVIIAFHGKPKPWEVKQFQK
jgi:lipopolysaccharide biosynthesis glycosyltransferase